MNKLKFIRQNKNISQKELSVLSGVSIGAITKYERQVRDINTAQARTVYKLAKALNCDMDKLLDIEENN